MKYLVIRSYRRVRSGQVVEGDIEYRCPCGNNKQTIVHLTSKRVPYGVRCSHCEAPTPINDLQWMPRERLVPIDPPPDMSEEEVNKLYQPEPDLAKTA